MHAEKKSIKKIYVMLNNNCDFFNNLCLSFQCRLCCCVFNINNYVPLKSSILIKFLKKLKKNLIPKELFSML